MIPVAPTAGGGTTRPSAAAITVTGGRRHFSRSIRWEASGSSMRGNQRESVGEGKQVLGIKT